MYVDDILLTDSNTTWISQTKEYLRKHFITKDMGKPRYFLRIEFAYGQGRMALSQRKNALDLLQETSLLGCKPENSPVDQNLGFWDDTSENDKGCKSVSSTNWEVDLLDCYSFRYFLCRWTSQSVMHQPRMVHW